MIDMHAEDIVDRCRWKGVTSWQDVCSIWHQRRRNTLLIGLSCALLWPLVSNPNLFYVAISPTSSSSIGKIPGQFWYRLCSLCTIWARPGARLQRGESGSLKQLLLVTWEADGRLINHFAQQNALVQTVQSKIQPTCSDTSPHLLFLL